MAFETILEFDKNNLYKVKLEVGNVDTSTVDSVKIDEEIADLLQEDSQTFSFCAREIYKYDEEYEYGHWVDTFSSNYNYDGGYFATDGIVDLDCEYYIDRFWNIKLENGELVLINTKHYEETIFTKENFPEDIEVDDVKDGFDKDAKYDVLITYEKIVEKDGLDNLFTDKDKDELEQLKVQIKDNFYSVTSVPVEIDWELCKGYARERGVSDEYLTEANLNRAVEYALQGIAHEYANVKDCLFMTRDNMIHVGTVGTNIAKYEDTAEADLEIINNLTLEKDDLGILRLYVSGEMQDDFIKAYNYKKVIERISNFIAYFILEREQANTYIQEINAKVKTILPSVMERFLTLTEIEKNKEWINKKLEFAKELSQSIDSYIKTKEEVEELLEADVKKKLMVTTVNVFSYHAYHLRTKVMDIISVLEDLKVGKSSFHVLHVDEVGFEHTLKSVKNNEELKIIRSRIEEVLIDRRDEKMVQEVEEVLAITKQQKLTTAEEQMVSAWNKYIGLKMEGKE